MTPDAPNTNNSLFPDQDFETEDQNSWQVSYLDIFTILLGFLFILLALSEINQADISSVSNLFTSSPQESRFITTPINEVKNELETLLKDEIESGKLEINRDLNDIRIRFNSDDLYQSGIGTLQGGALQLLDRVLKTIKKVRYDDFHINVEGHTDNTPISSEAYPSNWELSTARASNIVKYFANRGITKQRLKASGYADSRPRVPNEDSLGNPIPKNKDMNRRIVLRLYYTLADRKDNSRKPSRASSHRNTSNCRYAIQLGTYASFREGFRAFRNASQTTDLAYNMTYNSRLYSVRTTSDSLFSKALTKYQTISNRWNTSAPGLLHQCYTNQQKTPEPLDYVIQFGAFAIKSNAHQYIDKLATEHEISAHIADSSSSYYRVVTGPYERATSALAKLRLYQKLPLSSNIFIDRAANPTTAYSLDAQVQLGSFLTRQRAADYKTYTSKKLGANVTITQWGDKNYYVMGPKFEKLSAARSFYQKAIDELPDQSPVLHFFESM